MQTLRLTKMKKKPSWLPIHVYMMSFFPTFIDQLHIVAATKCSSGALSTSKQPPSIMS